MSPPVAARARATCWALQAAARTTWRVRRRPLDLVSVPTPHSADAALTGTVAAVLRRTRRSCLVRSLVLQRWRAALGDPRDLLVGVTAPSAGFTAHAWLDGESLPPGSAYTPLVRRSPEGRSYPLRTAERQEAT